MSWQTRRNRIIGILGKEGFRPETDRDGDVHFKYEGGNYWIMDTEDDGYFQLLYPNFWGIDDGAELGKALIASSITNRKTKVAKVWLTTDLKQTYSSAEIFVGDWSDLTGNIVIRCIRSISTAVDNFRNEMR